MKYMCKLVVYVCKHGVSPHEPQERFHACHVEEWRGVVELMELLETPWVTTTKSLNTRNPELFMHYSSNLLVHVADVKGGLLGADRKCTWSEGALNRYIIC